MAALPAEILVQLSLFRRQYFQMLELQQISWPSIDTLRNYQAQEWIYDKIFDSEKVQFPPPDRYRLRVLKPLIGRIEQSIVDPEEDEISDNLMSAFASLINVSLPSETNVAQQKDWVTYTPLAYDSQPEDQDPVLRLLENRSVISGAGTTGLRTWEAALRLGSYFLSSPEASALIKGKNVLELGAGTGFLSILCAKHLGARHVTITDGDSGVIDALKTNLSFNDIKDGVTAGVLLWGHALKGSFVEKEAVKHPLHTFIGADVTYDKSVIPSLVSTIRDIFELWPEANVIIAATIRNSETFSAFENACDSNQFGTQEIPSSTIPMNQQQALFHSTNVPIKILRISAPMEPRDPFAC